MYVLKFNEGFWILFLIVVTHCFGEHLLELHSWKAIKITTMNLWCSIKMLFYLIDLSEKQYNQCRQRSEQR